MAKIQLVIEIEERLYKNIIDNDKDDEEFEAMDMAFCDAKPLPKDATNGDMIETMFPDSHIVFGKEYGYHYVYVRADCEGSSWKIREEWWNAPYKRGEEDEISN